MSIPHNKPHSPLFSQAVLQELQSGLTQIPMRLCFALGPSALENLCAPFKNGVSVSPSPMELLCTSLTGLQCQVLQGLFLPVPHPHTWEFDVGLRTLTPVILCEPVSFQSLGLPTQEVWGCLYHIIGPPTS